MEALNKSNPSKGSQFKSFMKNKVGGFLSGTVLPGIKGALGGMAKGSVGDAKTLLLGPTVKKEGEKDGDEKGGKEKGGGEGKGSDGGMMGAIVHLTEEIATLKQQIATLQAKK